MSQRYESIRADRCPIDVFGPGETFDDETLSPNQYALVLGNTWASALAVYGTIEQISELLHQSQFALSNADNRRRFASITDLLDPCPVPDMWNGFDSCSHGAWPCPTTRAYWIANGDDPAIAAKRMIDAVPRPED
jgi:hypothetical protein